MANEGLCADLYSLVTACEDVRDGHRKALTSNEIVRLCDDLRRAIERLAAAED